MNRYCPICNSYSLVNMGKRSDFYPIDWYGQFVEDVQRFNRDIYRCGDCTFSFIYPMYSNEDYQELYNQSGHKMFMQQTEGYQSKEILKGVFPHWESLYRELGIHEWRDAFIQKHGRAPKLLDFGCGTGRLLYAFNKMGFDVLGVETDANACEFIANELKMPVKNCTFFELNADDKFDFIILSNVIEHVDDPIDFMKSAKNYLSSDGAILIETPWAEDSGVYEQRYRDIYHTLFFNHLSLYIMGLRSNLSFFRTINFSHFSLTTYHKYLLAICKHADNDNSAPVPMLSSLNAILGPLEVYTSNSVNTSLKIEEMKRIYEDLLKSKSYKLSQAIAKPYRFIRKTLFPVKG